jgi:5-methyltetrahydrofolate corrinoid/iron sulfur protein methyltransferase
MVVNMILIGENMQILSRAVSEALAGRESAPLQDLAVKQAAAGVDWLDLNVGPLRNNPAKTMSWLVEVIQEVVDLPLCLDTTNPVAMEAGLAVCKKRALINSAAGTQESKEKMLPLAKKFDANVVVSVLNDSGIPSDAASRAESIMETIEYANSLGIPNEDIWVDPILLPVGVNQQDILEVVEFIKMLPDIAPGVKSIIGLSNLSNGVPRKLRPLLNRVMMAVLEKAGLYSAIVDSFDPVLLDINNGKRQAIVDLIQQVMDGKEIALAGLSPEDRDYYKTARVIMSQEIYSPSWLEV